MARIRSVKPELWTDSKVVGLSPLARLLWLGSWNFADDYGCMPADPVQLKLRVLPAEPCDAEGLVDELLKADLLERLKSAEGESFWHVTNWEKHQKIDKRATPMFGLPDSWSADSPRIPAIPPESPQVPPTNGPGWEGIGKEGNGVASTKRTRERVGGTETQINSDGIWTALEDLFGKASTRTERSLRGKLVKSFAEAGATYTSVKERARWWPKLFPPRNGEQITLTATALEKWWGALGLLMETRQVRAAPCDVCDSRRIVGITVDGEIVRIDDPRAVGSDRCSCVTR
jgi:hypothetical protein